MMFVISVGFLAALLTAIVFTIYNPKNYWYTVVLGLYRAEEVVVVAAMLLFLQRRDSGLSLSTSKNATDIEFRRQGGSTGGSTLKYSDAATIGKDERHQSTAFEDSAVELDAVKSPASAPATQETPKDSSLSTSSSTNDDNEKDDNTTIQNTVTTQEITT
jgi:hypothetical protein